MTSAVVIAVDIGGTSIKAARIRGDEVTAELGRPTPVAQGQDAVVAAVLDMVRALAAPDGPAAVGVVAPGAVDGENGVFRYSANLGWHDVPMRAVLHDATGLPVAIGHDVRSAGLAEAAFGATRETTDALVVMLGTGVAGLVTSGGVPVTGAGGLAGEIGHIPVWPDGEKCPCGQRGCLERYSSASAIARRYAQLTAAGATSATAADIAARLEDDAVAAQVWDEATTALGLALATATMLLDPELIVIGGGLSAAGDALLLPVREELQRRVTWREVPRLELSPLGARAGIFGAALLARTLI